MKTKAPINLGLVGTTQWDKTRVRESKQARYEARKRAENKKNGLVERRVWIRAEHTPRLVQFVKSLNEGKV